MFYALRIALVIALLAGLVSLPSSLTLGLAWLVLAALYAVAFWVIVKNFRFIRFKEVDTVFTACFISQVQFGSDEVKPVVAVS